MKTVSRGPAAAVLAIALAGCAASPESIKPASIGTAQYAYLNCAQLADYKVTLTNAYTKAADSEDNARMLDAATSLTLGFPVGSMTHESVPYQISDLKGRIVAVNKLQVQGNCNPQRQVAAAQ
ncbi:MAG TPA: hypothetical protein VHT03_07320 [Rhizomicrobium sp.]|jgi:hypothetical protein|nr:hypothetical protein [Rhizomicrobium sp.]